MGGRQEEEKNIDMRETDPLVASYTCPDRGRGSNLQPRYLPWTGNWTCDPLVRGLTLVTTDKTGQNPLFLMLTLWETTTMRMVPNDRIPYLSSKYSVVISNLYGIYLDFPTKKSLVLSSWLGTFWANLTSCTPAALSTTVNPNKGGGFNIFRGKWETGWRRIEESNCLL